MRVDKPQTQNTFNNMLIVFFFIGSSNILHLLFFRTNPIMYGNNIQDTITKYEICEEKYKVVNATTWQNINGDTDKLLATSYAQQEALKIFTISDERGKKYIKGNKKFFKNGVYDHQLFLNHLKNIQAISKTRITEQDYINYIKIHVAVLMFEKMRSHGMKNMNVGKAISSNVDARGVKVTLLGHKVEVDKKTELQDNFTKEEINHFIQQQIRNRIRYYLDLENVSGFMLIVKIGLNSSNVIEAVNFFLKQEVFEKEHLYSYMEQVALDSDNFDKIGDYQKIMTKWKKNNKKAEKKVDLSPFFEIEELNKVEETSDNGYLFNIKHVIHKDFTVIRSSYRRFITKEHNKEKKKKLTEEDIKDYVIPTMRLIKQKENQLKKAYNIAYTHNDGTNKISLSKNNHIIRIENPLFKFDTDMHNKAIVMFDNTGYPFVFLVEKVIVDLEGKALSVEDQLTRDINTLLDQFMNFFLYKRLFDIYYNKTKNQYQA